MRRSSGAASWCWPSDSRASIHTSCALRNSSRRRLASAPAAGVAGRSAGRPRHRRSASPSAPAARLTSPRYHAARPASASARNTWRSTSSSAAAMAYPPGFGPAWRVRRRHPRAASSRRRPYTVVRSALGPEAGRHFPHIAWQSQARGQVSPTRSSMSARAARCTLCLMGMGSPAADQTSTGPSTRNVIARPVLPCCLALRSGVVIASPATAVPRGPDSCHGGRRPALVAKCQHIPCIGFGEDIPERSCGRRAKDLDHSFS